MPDNNPIPNDESLHLRKFYPLDPMSDRPFAIGCMDILHDDLQVCLDLWLTVRRLGPRPAQPSGDRFSRFLAEIELGEVIKILSPETAADLRIYAELGKAADGRGPFSLSAPRTRSRVDRIAALKALQNIADGESTELYARIVRLNLGTGRNRLRLAARTLDHELTYIASRARETASYRFGRLNDGLKCLESVCDLDLEYGDSLSKIEALAAEGIRLSRAAMDRPSETSRVYWSSVLFTRLCNGLTSLLKLLPGSNHSSVDTDHIWDFAAIASIVRSILECALFHFYLCTEDVDQEEWSARQHLMFLHDATSRLRIFYSEDSDTDERVFTAGQRDELAHQLKSNSYFSELPEKQQRRFLSGKHASFLSQDEILVRMGVDAPSSFRHVYEFLSSHTHSLPISFYRVSVAEDGRGRGIENPAEKGFMVRSMEVCSWITEASHKHFISVHPPLSKSEGPRG